MATPRTEELLKHREAEFEVEKARKALRAKIAEAETKLEGTMLALSKDGAFRLDNDDELGSQVIRYERELKDLIAQAGGWIPENLRVQVPEGEPDVIRDVSEDAQLD